MSNDIKLFTTVSTILYLIVLNSNTVCSLECYKCSNNHHNWMDCTKQKVECKSFQDACTSFVSFHRFLNYQPRGEKWHNISKGCDTVERCNFRADIVNQALCDRSSYEEWACVECCTGDLCNYFVTLGSPKNTYIAPLTTLFCLFIAKLSLLIHEYL